MIITLSDSILLEQFFKGQGSLVAEMFNCNKTITLKSGDYYIAEFCYQKENEWIQKHISLFCNYIEDIKENSSSDGVFFRIEHSSYNSFWSKMTEIKVNGKPLRFK